MKAPRKSNCSIGTGTPGQLLSLSLFAVVGACAGAPAPAPTPTNAVPVDSPFPAKQALADVAARAPVRDAFVKMISPDTWTLAGPFPRTIAAVPRAPETGWERIMFERAAGEHAMPSEGMRCVAREYGRFVLSVGERPSQNLEARMIADCGAPVAGVSIRFLSGKVPADATEADVHSGWRGPFAELFDANTAENPPRYTTLGAWFGKEGGKAVAIAVVGLRRVKVAPIAMIPNPDGGFTVRGAALFPVEAITGVVNRGDLGFSVCRPDQAIALPHFSLRCDADPGDARARFVVSARPTGRILAEAVLVGAVWPGGQPSEDYERPAYPEFETKTAPGGFAKQFTELVNRARRRVGHGPLTLETSQSEVASSVANAYFASRLGVTAPEEAEQIALGLQAGWDVDGRVRYGTFASTWFSKVDDAGEMMSTILDQPTSRQVLLDVNVARVAVGGLTAPESSMIGMLFATYAVVNPAESRAAADRVRAQIDARRGAAMRTSSLGLPALGDAAKANLDGVASGAQGAEDALGAILEVGSKATQRSLQGWVIEASTLDALTIPEPLLLAPTLELEVMVTHRNVAGHPWARYVVYLVAVAPGVAI